MPSTYTTSLKLELIANGEQATTWGETTNNNMGTLIEQAITGVQPITLTGDTVLTNYNGLPDESRNAVLVFNGSLANAANVVVPAVSKVYVISNRAGANVTVKTTSGTGVTLSNGVSTFVYCDGINFFTAVDTSNITGDLTVSGNQTVGGGITIGGDITLKTKITSNTGTLTLTGSTNIVDMATNTGAFIPPYGTNGDRPGTPQLGMGRWNSTGGYMEIWNGVQWQNITGNYAIDYVIVAGGGGGGYWKGGGGGGAGGLLANTTTVAVGTAYTITVGSGGGSTTKGSNSSAFSLTAIGGGYGAGQFGDLSYTFSGGSGGSGGGAIDWTNSGGSAGSVGSGTSGQGYAGGLGGNGNANGGNAAGGGGGAGAVGGAGTAGGFGDGGAGGVGYQSSISGTATYYAGGGGGGLTRQFFSTGSNQGGAGGLGGGGKGGGSNPDTAGVSGTANTGGGGGGSGENYTTQTETGAGSGGSGIVVIRYASASQRGTGGTVTSYSDAGITYFVHTFTTSGTFTA